MVKRVVGTGSFGIVFQAKCLETGEIVAIKKVLQDRRYKNRELQLMRTMNHPNAISLKHCFFSTTSKDELFLNLVMEYVPEIVCRALRPFSEMNRGMPLFFAKLYTYQIFRVLAYIHTVLGIYHGDAKPQNILVDPVTHWVKLCDFGSAKILKWKLHRQPSQVKWSLPPQGRAKSNVDVGLNGKEKLCVVVPTLRNSNGELLVVKHWTWRVAGLSWLEVCMKKFYPQFDI